MYMFLRGGIPGDGGNKPKLLAYSQIYWVVVCFLLIALVSLC